VCVCACACACVVCVCVRVCVYQHLAEGLEVSRRLGHLLVVEQHVPVDYIKLCMHIYIYMYIYIYICIYIYIYIYICWDAFLSLSSTCLVVGGGAIPFEKRKRFHPKKLLCYISIL
jgi:hypothetical protein